MTGKELGIIYIFQKAEKVGSGCVISGGLVVGMDESLVTYLALLGRVE